MRFEIHLPMKRTNEGHMIASYEAAYSWLYNGNLCDSMIRPDEDKWEGLLAIALEIHYKAAIPMLTRRWKSGRFAAQIKHFLGLMHARALIDYHGMVHAIEEAQQSF